MYKKCTDLLINVKKKLLNIAKNKQIKKKPISQPMPVSSPDEKW